MLSSRSFVAGAMALCLTVAPRYPGARQDNAGAGSPSRTEIGMAANLVYSVEHQQVLMVSGPSGAAGDLESCVWAWDGRRWNSIGEGGPPGRTLGAAVYDDARRRVLLFGGLRQRENLDEMWAWTGVAWRVQTDTTAGPRDHHVMAYDSGRDRVVLFGGSGRRPAGSDRKLSPEDTWEWDGDRWMQVATSGPSNRGRSAMVYDEKRREVVLFGGGGDQVLGDTWIWNGQRWRMSDRTGPRPRYAHALAYDADREVVVLYGGSTFTPVQHLVDMWEWNGDRWTEISMPAVNPGVRYSPGMAYDRHRRRLVLYGGATMNDRRELQPAFDTWEWDGRRWTTAR